MHFYYKTGSITYSCLSCFLKYWACLEFRSRRKTGKLENCTLLKFTLLKIALSRESISFQITLYLWNSNYYFSCKNPIQKENLYFGLPDNDIHFFFSYLAVSVNILQPPPPFTFLDHCIHKAPRSSQASCESECIHLGD